MSGTSSTCEERHDIDHAAYISVADEGHTVVFVCGCEETS